MVGRMFLPKLEIKLSHMWSVLLSCIMGVYYKTD